MMQLQDKLSKQSASTEHNCPINNSEEENTGFPGSNTDEKAPGNLSNLSEEFLHHHQSQQHWFSLIENNHRFENASIYTAFHGELLVPPPNFI